MSSTHSSDNRAGPSGFTLLELLIVLMVIAVMVTVAVPYASRSNKGLKAEQVCLSLAETAKYAMDLAVDKKKPTRVVVDPRNRSFLLEVAVGPGGRDYEPVNRPGFETRYFGQDIYITDAVGFDIDGGKYCLVFDPARPWPDASISMSSSNALKTIRIHGRQVEIEDSGI